MNVTVNGKLCAFEAAMSAADLLKPDELDRKHTIIEINHDIIDREAYDSVMLSDGDTIELISFMGGGA